MLPWSGRTYHEKKLLQIKFLGKKFNGWNLLEWNWGAQESLMIQVSNMSMHSGGASVQMPIMTK